MEKIIKSRWEDLPPVKLYLDDIEKIVEILREVSTTIKIETDEYSIEDVKELASLDKERVTELNIQSAEPYLNLRIGPQKSWLNIAKDEPSSRGTFEKIKEVLFLRRRKALGFLDKWSITFPLTWLLGFATVEFMIKAIRGGGTLFIIGSIISPLILLFYLLLASYFWSHGSFIIILRRRSQEQSFIKRNKDRIIVGVLLALVSGAIGLIIGRLTK